MNDGTRPVIVFDDGGGLLAPLTDLRASFDVRTGAATNLERIERVLGVRAAGLVVPARLERLVRERHGGGGRRVNRGILEGEEGGAALDLSRGAIVVNGRCVLPREEMRLCGAGEGYVEAGGDLIAGGTDAAGVRGLVMEGAAPSVRSAGENLGHVLLARPWHVRALRDRALLADLPKTRDDRRKTPAGTIMFGEHALAIEASAKVYPGVVLDLEHGPIAIDEGAVVRPGSTIIGPASIGPNSTVLDRGIIKGGTAIGPWCKVAGEVGGTIFQGYANKGHEGHLGDSWVGEWANLGAGTTNSNLLNTYGEVLCRAGADQPNERTGQQFLGAVIGDHVKTAICTRMMTGCIVGTGTMWAATAPISGTVEGFAWATDAGRKRYAWGKFEEVMRAAMGRRKVSVSEAYLSAVKARWGAGGA